MQDKHSLNRNIKCILQYFSEKSDVLCHVTLLTETTSANEIYCASKHMQVNCFFLLYVLYY